MYRGVRTTFLLIFVSLFLFSCFHLHLHRNSISNPKNVFFTFSADNLTINTNPKKSDINYKHAIYEVSQPLSYHIRRVASIKYYISTVSILFPDWEVLLIVSPETPILMTSLKDKYVCLFQNNHTSQASFAGVLPFSNLTTFKCVLPNTVRRLRPFFQPTLLKTSSDKLSPVSMSELLKFSFLVYESLSTEDDIVLFVKGLNHRQGTNRSPSEFRCVFGNVTKDNVVKTAVTSSVQEVFRCSHPNLTGLDSGENDLIKVSLEIIHNNLIVPSVAHYTPRRTVVKSQPKSQLCACTMVYNVGKFLKEWVTYHSKIGVDKFILYDNDSNDNLTVVVDELNKEGYNITTLFWIWPKTQEAGFSHSAIYGNSSCIWMMYIDIDEFIYSPSWNNESQPSNYMLKLILPKASQAVPSFYRQIGQVLIRCNDFGPSNHRSHPIEGVTQGYTCRRKVEQRHKSIVFLNAVDHSLLNVVHHFQLRSDYRSKRVSVNDIVVNHYKYQAWPEFHIKFRRRVSAYVADWKQTVNPNSKDRTPGLGFEAIEPKDWATKFCEVNDDRLKKLTTKWLSSKASNGYKMAWQ